MIGFRWRGKTYVLLPSRDDQNRSYPISSGPFWRLVNKYLGKGK